MSEPLSAKEFRDFVDLYTTNHADHTGRLDKIDARLGVVETLLWQGERIAEIERRVVKLGELSGDASLAVPLHPPIGSNSAVT